MKKTKRSFTIAELLIVVGILGVLAAIAIPTYFSVLTRSRETVCKNNRDSLYHLLEADYLLGGDALQEKLDDYTANPEHLDELGYVCPAGGRIGVSVDTQTGQYSVFCTKHGGQIMGSNMAQAVVSYMDGALGEKIVELFTQGSGNKTLAQIDSSVPGGGNYAGPISDTLKELTQDSMGAGMSTTWALQNVNVQKNVVKKTYRLFWSSVDIVACAKGQQVLMMYYDAATGSYQSGWADVTTNSDKNFENGKPYNRIKVDAADPFQTIPGSNESFDAAYKAFLRELDATGGVREGI